MGVVREEGDVVDPDEGHGHAADKRERQQGPRRRGPAQAHLRNGQQQARGDEEGPAAEAVAEDAGGQREQAGRQRRHAGDLADEVLLIAQAQ